MTRVPGGVELDVEHLLGDDPALARSRETRILNGVLQVKQHARRVARIALVHQHRAAAQEIAVTFQGEIEHSVEQRMARTNKSGERLALGRDQRLLKGDALIALQDRLADADQAIAIADRAPGHG